MPHHYVTVAILLLLLACVVCATDKVHDWRQARRDRRRTMRLIGWYDARASAYSTDPVRRQINANLDQTGAAR